MRTQQRSILDTEIRFSLRRDDRDELEGLARAGDRSLSAEVRRAIRLYIPWARAQADATASPEQEAAAIRL